MSNKDKILEVLEQEELTSSEIANRTGIDIDTIYVYLNRMVKKNEIKRITDKKPYLYAKKQDPKETLDKLVLLMIKAGINSSEYNIEIKESEIENSVKRLQKEGRL